MHVPFQNNSIKNLLGPNNKAKKGASESEVVPQSLFFGNINDSELAHHEIKQVYKSRLQHEYVIILNSRITINVSFILKKIFRRNYQFQNEYQEYYNEYNLNSSSKAELCYDERDADLTHNCYCQVHVLQAFTV